IGAKSEIRSAGDRRSREIEPLTSRSNLEITETMIHRTVRQIAIRKLLNCQNGFLLSAALTLLTALMLLGTTAFILSSTDIKIGGNFRNNQMVLQVAMAGAERARETLRVENLASS